MTAVAEDAELLRAWRGGDRAAGDALMRRYYTRVYRFFELKAQWMAEDLTQRTLLACLEQQGELRDDAAFAGYLFGIARNQLLMALRRPSPGRLLERFGEEAPAVNRTHMSTLASRRQEQQLLLRAMTELPPDTQMTLSLYYWEEMQAPALAEVFGISASAMRSRLVKARTTLREVIEGLAAAPASRASLLRDVDGWARSVAREGG
jgi:RNA polymerase sigma factor (sigma-70 family)